MKENTPTQCTTDYWDFVATLRASSFLRLVFFHSDGISPLTPVPQCPQNKSAIPLTSLGDDDANRW